MKRAAAVFLAATVLVPLGPAAADQAPDWVEAARKAPIPSMAARTPLVNLIEEELVDVSRSATRTHVRQAFKILTLDGLHALALRAHQRIGQDFKLIGGWIVRPDGSASRFDGKAILQVDADGSYEFTMSKINIFRPEELRVGDIVAWEYELRSRTEAYIESWRFGWTWPTLVSRFGLKLPEGWTQRSVLRNHEDVPPVSNDEGYLVWEMRELPAVKDEPLSLPVSDLVPALAVSYGPAGGESDKRQFDTWQSVGRWYATLIAQQTVADESVRQAASQAVGPAAPGLESIRAVTRFVQGVRYLNIAPGRSTAQPHPAALVLKNRFGDCEDKSVLTITMLKQIGVDAYPVQARTRHIGALETEFPAPNQFNHAVVAIKAPADADLPSTIDGGPLGRLVVFDPTDSSSGLGDLSPSLQGTRGVLSDTVSGGLITLPVLAPETSSRESEVAVTFGTTGGIAVKARFTYTGQYAAAKRWHFGEVRGEKRREEIASLLASRHGKAEVTRLEVEGVENPGDPVVLTFDVSMKLPGRDLGSMRTLATQFLLGSRAEILDETERRTPLHIDGGYRELERTTVELPTGWKAAMPLPSLRASCVAGDYLLAARAEGSRLTLERSLTVKAATIPPADYAPVKKFFDDVARGDASSVAMEKSPQ